MEGITTQYLKDKGIASVTIRQQSGRVSWPGNFGFLWTDVAYPRQIEIERKAVEFRAAGIEVKLTGPKSIW